VGVKKGFENKGYGKYMYKQISNRILTKIDFSISFCIYFLIPEEDLTFWKTYLKKLENFLSISQLKHNNKWGNFYILKIKSTTGN